MGKWCLRVRIHGDPLYTIWRVLVIPDEEEAPSFDADTMADHIFRDDIFFLELKARFTAEPLPSPSIPSTGNLLGLKGCWLYPQLSKTEEIVGNIIQNGRWTTYMLYKF